MFRGAWRFGPPGRRLSGSCSVEYRSQAAQGDRSVFSADVFSQNRFSRRKMDQSPADPLLLVLIELLQQRSGGVGSRFRLFRLADVVFAEGLGQQLPALLPCLDVLAQRRDELGAVWQARVSCSAAARSRWPTAAAPRAGSRRPVGRRRSCPVGGVGRPH